MAGLFSTLQGANGITFGSAGPGNFRTVELTNDHMQRAISFLGDFQADGVHSTMVKLMGSWFGEMSHDGPQGGNSGVIDEAAFGQQVLVPLMMVHMGLMLTKKQSDTLQMLMSMVSITHVPENTPQKSHRFLIKYKVTKQLMAAQGGMTSKVPSRGNSWYNTEIFLQSYVTGFNIADMSFMLKNNPQDVTQAFADSMQSLDTTWALTLVYLYAAYASHQPTLHQLLYRNHLTHRGNSGFSQLLQVIMSEVTNCGALNRSRHNMMTLLNGLAEVVEMGDDRQMCCLYSTGLANGATPDTERGFVNSERRMVTYSTRNPMGIEDYLQFSEKPVESVMGANGQLPAQLVSLSNGGEAVMIPIDGNGSDDCCDRPLRSDGIMRTFITVGSVPDIYRKCCQTVFDGTAKGKGGGMCATSLSCHSPNFSYFYDFDLEKVRMVTVAECNDMLSSDQLFEEQTCMDDWLNVFSKDMLGYVDEEAMGKMVDAPTRDLQDSPLSIFETNPRMMFCRTMVSLVSPTKTALDRNGTGGQEYVYLISRGLMGNASPWSDFQAEMCNTVGHLCGLAAAGCQDLVDLMDTMKKCLDMVDPLSTEAFRDHDVDRATALTLTGYLSQWVAYEGLMADPQCQVQLLKMMEKATDLMAAGPTAAAGNDQAAIDGLRSFVSDNNERLQQAKLLIIGGKQCLMDFMKSTFKDKLYHLFYGADEPLIRLNTNIDRVWYPWLRLAYGLMMPALSHKVWIPSSAGYVQGVNLGYAGVSRHLHMGQLPGGAVWVGDAVGTPGGGTIIPPYGSPDTRLSMIRPQFEHRLRTVMRMYSTQPMVKLMAHIHYFTVLSSGTLKNHHDRHYPSGMAYRGIRQIAFQGHSLVGLPKQGARLLIGNRGAAFPVSGWEQTEYKQMMELGITPLTMTSTGVGVPNVFLSDISGVGGCIDPSKDPRSMIILDCYPRSLPEGQWCHQSEYPLVSVHGRFDSGEDLMGPDVSGMIVQDPTTMIKTSGPLRWYRQQNRNYDEDSSLGLLDKALAVGSFQEGLPQYIQQAMESGFQQKDAMEQVLHRHNGSKTIFTDRFGGIVTDNYTVGYGSGGLLRGMSPSALCYDPCITPRIRALGGLIPSGDFGADATDPPFMASFSKQTSIAKMSQFRNF